MKKIIIAVVALAAFAGAASAQNRSYDLRDLDTVNGQSSSGIYLPATKSGVSTVMAKKPLVSIIDHTDEHTSQTR